VVCTEHPFLRFPRKEAERAIRSVYAGEGRRLNPVTVIFTTSTLIRGINRTFLRHDRATDVISFPLAADRQMRDEIYINLDYARRQARDYGVRFQDEARRLLIHGSLHLLGYRDDSLRRRDQMRRREDHYLVRLT